MKKYILAIDLGTTGNRVIAFSKDGKIVAKSYYEFPQIFPQPGWVEHNPYDILETTLKALKDVLDLIGSENVESIGITNQRETTILWDRESGKPVYNAIVWQCRRTKYLCDKIRKYESIVKRKTGLRLDPYFSATKIRWILENVEKCKELLTKGRLIFGTVDSWILWNLTGGRVHATDTSNACRTLCFNIHTLGYDKDLLEIFSIPAEILPEVKESGTFFGFTDKNITGVEIPITGIIGDQQASLFAHGGWNRNIVKNTYGTGLFLMSSTGNDIKLTDSLLTTIAWTINGETTYALEGSVFTGGSVVQWLRDGLKVIKSASETEEIAEKLPSNEGVYFVPALTGLGSPYWDSDARGMIIGLTRGTTVNHIVRAALEAIAYQTRDVVEEMRKTDNKNISVLKVDGGASKNNFLMQFQSDILNIPVERPEIIETTACGAAGIAGITVGFWSIKKFSQIMKTERTFLPSIDENTRELLYQKWKEAVKRSLGWTT